MESPGGLPELSNCYCHPGRAGGRRGGQQRYPGIDRLFRRCLAGIQRRLGETVHAGLFTREAAIREAVLFTAKRAAWLAGNTMTARYVDTLFDEDRLPHYKMMASRFTVVG